MHYSLRVVDPGQAILQFYECEYPNPLDAVEAAKRLLCDGSVEIWLDTSRIATVSKNGVAIPTVPKTKELQ